LSKRTERAPRNWRAYQERVATFFRSLGLEATADLTVEGIRTTHAIDVFVKSFHVGFDVVWIVECKHWAKKITKLHVLALRQIVTDVGADRGILLSERGFQSGAVEAATLTNVRVTSLADLRGTASADIMAMRLRELYDRVESCKKRYWDIPKHVRIDCGLRPEVGAGGYSGNQVIDFAKDVITKALRGVYPVEVDHVYALVLWRRSRRFSNAKQIVSLIEPMIADLERKLTACGSKK
jgi:hypothetical protein